MAEKKKQEDKNRDKSDNSSKNDPAFDMTSYGAVSRYDGDESIEQTRTEKNRRSGTEGSSQDRGRGMNH